MKRNLFASLALLLLAGCVHYTDKRPVVLTLNGTNQVVSMHTTKFKAWAKSAQASGINTKTIDGTYSRTILIGSASGTDAIGDMFTQLLKNALAAYLANPSVANQNATPGIANPPALFNTSSNAAGH